jgi:hypothetical protein
VNTTILLSTLMLEIGLLVGFHMRWLDDGRRMVLHFCAALGRSA